MKQALRFTPHAELTVRLKVFFLIPAMNLHSSAHPGLRVPAGARSTVPRSEQATPAFGGLSGWPETGLFQWCGSFHNKELVSE